MRRIWFVAALTAWGTGACGQTADGEQGSGLPATMAVGELTAGEQQQLCLWSIDTLGGEGAEYPCGSESVTVEWSLTDCVESLGPCVATVSDVETCIEEQRAALEGCALRVGPACERLTRLCEDPGDDVTVSSTQPATECMPGETEQCTCEDGSFGARQCNDAGEYGPCDCAPSAGCLSGETFQCACVDGSLGVQTCTGEGVLSACACPAPPVQGSCNPAYCPAAGSGTPCCVTPNGPCGLDFGSGCTSSLPGG